MAVLKDLSSYETISLLQLTPDEFILGVDGKLFFETNLTEFSDDVFYFKDFFSSNYFVHQPSTIFTLSKDELSKLLPSAPPLVQFTKIGDNQLRYEEQFHNFKNSPLNKVVLTGTEAYQLTSPGQSMPWEFWIKKSLEVQGATSYAFVYSKDGRQHGLVGATPELLFNLNENDQFDFQALASTVIMGEESQLSECSKYQNEFQWVIEDITSKLTKLNFHLELAPTSFKKFQSLIHLQKKITGKLASIPNLNKELAKLVNSLSPTAALGGFPAHEALKFLRALDLRTPRLFGSAFGIKTKMKARFIVAIRNIQWQEKEFSIETGTGIVHQSLLGKELEEVQRKRTQIANHYLRPLQGHFHEYLLQKQGMEHSL
jgi:isochorismate synthase EntC